MPGPPPSYTRTRRAAPATGEWRTIPPTSGLKAPRIPVRRIRKIWTKDGTEVKIPGGFGTRAKRAWAAWWEDGAATEWTSSDWDSLEQALHLLEDYDQTGDTRAETALRMRLDSLGLTPKGKRDLRLLVVVPKVEEEPAAEDSEIARKRAERDAALVAAQSG